MAHEAIERNDQERERLFALVERLSDDELRRQIATGWTVSSTFAHLAFWDVFATLLLERWLEGESVRFDAPPWYDDLLNDSMLLSWLSVEPQRATALAGNAAADIDARLAALDAASLARLDSEDEDTAWLLRRFRHRAEHLDAIEQALVVEAQR